MQYDKQITISTAGSRKSTNWQPASMLVSEFYKRLETPQRGKETIAEYLGYKKAQQDELKDCCGGFVGGALNGPRRKAENVAGRDLVTLDFDSMKPDQIRLVPRDRVCALEVWCEAFGGSVKDYSNRDAIEINAIINAAPEWQRTSSPIHIGGGYSKQRGFYRAATNHC